MLRVNGFFVFAELALAFAGFFAAIVPSRSSAQEAIPAGPTAVFRIPNAVRLTLDQSRQTDHEKNRALVLENLNVDQKHLATAAANERLFSKKVMGSETYFHFDKPLGSVLTTRAGSTISVDVANQDTSLATVFVAQPITKLIAVNAAVQVSRADECIAQAKLDQGTKDLLSGVTQAYYGLIGAQRIQSALQLQGTVLEQQVAATQSPQLRIGYIELRQGMVQVQGQVRELMDQLDDLLGFAPGTPLELADPVPPVPPVQSAEQTVAMALMCNADVREAEQKIVKAEAGMKIAKMAYLPDVNVIGGYANQTSASYIQPDIGYLGVTASYTFWEWGKKRDVCAESESTLALARQNLQVTRDKVQLEARKSYGSFEQALESARLAEQMVHACSDAERGVADPSAVLTAKSATAKAQLELMKADIAYRVADAQLMRTIGN